MSGEGVRYERDGEGIVTLVVDDPSQDQNTMSAAYIESMGRAVDRLRAERDADPDGLRGVVVTSAKPTFFAGGDLTGMVRATPDDAAELLATIQEVKRQLRALETLGRPVVAAMSGSALGGGYEIALACHHRIAVDDGRSEFGLPEVTLGLLPGAGGVTRTVRMFGLQQALTGVLLEGPRMKPARALAAGLVDELVDDEEALLPAARAWVDAHHDDPDASTQPWDRDGYRIPGGSPSTPKLAQALPGFAANLRKQTKGAPYAAPRAIMAAAVEGAQVDIDTALRIESRYLVDLMTRQQFKDMTQAFFFDLRHVNAGGSRPRDHDRWRPSRVAVVGAGMMGAGIAYATARSGTDVVLQDVDLGAAERGKAYSADLLDRAVDKGRLSSTERDDVLARIRPTADVADLGGCDLLIEAVFEDMDLKHRVLGETEPVLAADALLASNTSALPISALAEGVRRRDDFLGLHFFSPADKMPLVEIIVGAQTSDAALARAYDYVRSIRKTPIVVNDSRGFFTSRVFATLLMEAVGMVGEGCNPVSIERAATQAGFPAPPLAMLDEVSLTLVQHIDAAAARAPGHTRAAGMATVDRLADDFDRRGKAAGAGFYVYPEGGGRKHLWPGLWDQLGCSRDGDSPVPFADMRQRLTFAMTLESVRCLDEGVLRSVPDANVGSILGIGFPPLLGGVLQHVNGYAGGPPGFVARARELAAAYGERFDPPESLVALADAGRTYR